MKLLWVCSVRNYLRSCSGDFFMHIFVIKEAEVKTSASIAGDEAF
jgi:hypothetical protein